MFNMCLIFLSQKFIMQLLDSALFGSFLFFTLRSIRRSRRPVSYTHLFLLENEMMVYIVIFDRKTYQISGKLFDDIAVYIDDLSLIHI